MRKTHLRTAPRRNTLPQRFHLHRQAHLFHVTCRQSVIDTISLLTDDVELTWDAPTDGTTPFTYRVERASDRLFTQHTRTIANNLSARTHTSTGLFAQTYYYRVIATNVGGDGPESETVSVDIPLPANAPLVVRDLTVSYEDGEGAILSWDIPARGYRPITYKIERATNAAFTQNASTIVAARAVTEFTDNGPSGGFVDQTTYYYRITPRNISGLGPADTVNVTAMQPSTLRIPTVVGNLRIGYVGGLTVDLIWAAPDIGTTPITYEIRRDTEAAFLSPVTLEAANATTLYSDTGPTGGLCSGQNVLLPGNSRKLRRNRSYAGNQRHNKGT